MNILYITHQFMPEYVAGTEILTYRTAKRFLNRGDRAGVFTGYPTSDEVERHGRLDFYTYGGIPVFRCGYHRRFAIGAGNQMKEEYDNALVLEHFRRVIVQFKPDLVHIYHLHRLSVKIVEVCKKFGIPVVFSVTDYWVFCPTCQLLLSDGTICEGPDRHMANCFRHMAEYAGKAKILKTIPDAFLGFFIKMAASRVWPENLCRDMLRALLNRPASIRSELAKVDMFLVPTRFMKRLLIQAGFDREKIRTIPFGVQYPDGGPSNRKNASRKLRVGFIGSLLFHKGAHVLCEALRFIPRDMPVEIGIHGSPEPSPDYVRRLKNIVGDDPRVCFHGGFHPDLLYSILSGMDVLAVPSLWHENTPLVIHSAQAFDLPVIAADVGGIGEVVSNNDNGLLFEKGNAKSLAAIIETLCRDRCILEGLSKRARHPLSIDSYADEIAKVYRECL